MPSKGTESGTSMLLMVRRQHLFLVGVVVWYVNASDGEKAAPLSGGGRSLVRQCF